MECEELMSTIMEIVQCLQGGSASVTSGERPQHHQVQVVRIAQIEKHPCADTLGIVRIAGYQTIIKLGEFTPGDLAAYIPPDSVVPQEEEFAFLWADHGFAEDDIVPLKYRRVIPRKIRQQWSEGLLIRIPEWVRVADSGEIREPREGDDIADALGVVHYQPPEADEVRPKRRWLRWLPGWCCRLLGRLGFSCPAGASEGNQKGPKRPRPVYDVAAYKNYPGSFCAGEPVLVTEKIHGSNARYSFDGGVMYAGSRALWKHPRKGGVWRTALAQNPQIETWCRAHPGYTLYGEVVPTRGGKFNYGCAPGQVRFFLFDILDPNGQWVNKDYLFAVNEGFISARARLELVPVLYRGPFDEAVITALAEGNSEVPRAQQIREGIVIRSLVERYLGRLGRVQLKIVSNRFLEQSAAPGVQARAEKEKADGSQ
jgi:hypothetical protein